MTDFTKEDVVGFLKRTEDMSFSEAIDLLRVKETGLVCRRETYAQMADDIRPLLIRHWEELAAYPEIPLDPDWDFYRAAAEADLIRGYTARLDGQMIGYAIFTIVRRHPHYARSFAISDILLVLPEHRNFKVGSALFDCFEADLAGFVISISTKNSHPALQALCSIRGYEAISSNYSKRF